MKEKKFILPSLRNQDWKNHDRTRRVVWNIPTDITKLNALIYARTKLVNAKIGITLRNRNRNTNIGWEMKMEGQIKKLREQEKIIRKKYTRIQRNEKTEKKITADKTDNGYIFPLV